MNKSNVLFSSTVTARGQGSKYLKLNLPVELNSHLGSVLGNTVFFKEPHEIEDDFYGLDPTTGKGLRIKRVVIDILPTKANS
ncbi:hypothetical protein [Methanosarcina siciliae]|uniref:hypothetical protein n=1 Tax=Methanosarcina siciliae TaxID=38027 RepID=UPI000AA819EA|nr:hypothetical protein [Methanosarcina siciliae]